MWRERTAALLFLLIYVAFVLLLGIPVMMAEILIGRAGRRGPMQALGVLASEAGASRYWRWLGLFGAFTVFCILSFYSVVSGWSIEFLVASVNGNFDGASAAEIGAGFEAFLANPGLLIFNHSLFLFMTMTVVAAGVAKGLERLNNLLMPLLYGLLLLLAVYATTTTGFGTALSWLFLPSFADVTPAVVLHAMGHAFFTLAVGACALMAYGAYMPDEQSLPKAAFAVAVLDISVALLAGIAIFSVVFAQGMDPADGPGLMFVTLPIAFSELPWGSLWLSVFFLTAAARHVDLGDQLGRANGGNAARAGLATQCFHRRGGHQRLASRPAVGVFIFHAGRVPATAWP